MHYIIGTKIFVNSAPVKAGTTSGPRSVGAVRVKRNVDTKHFQPGIQYELFYIKKDQDNKMLYTFVDESTEEKFDVVFDSTSAADRYIAKILGEVLPDYNKFYDKRV
jgi:hypothetical protein